MGDSKYKKFTIQAKKGIKGEAFFESLACSHSLPIQIVGLKDIGIDYICQWIYEDRPTPILYAVQVKFFSTKKQPEYIRTRKNFNNLKEYRIVNKNLKIDGRTLDYWRTLSMPVFLFAVCFIAQEATLYYKRYTPIVTKPNENFDFYSEFYQVNNGGEFLVYGDPSLQTGGFVRDLFIDYIRCNYYKGSIAYLNPLTIGLHQFPEDNIFPELFEEYQDKIIPTYAKTKLYLEKILPLSR